MSNLNREIQGSFLSIINITSVRIATLLYRTPYKTVGTHYTHANTPTKAFSNEIEKLFIENPNLLLPKKKKRGG